MSRTILVRTNVRLVVAASSLALLIGAQAHAESASIPFAIRVDGQPVDRSAPAKEAPARRKSDLSVVDVQVKFDGLDVKPVLSVTGSQNAGGDAVFLSRTNYPDFITRSEIIIERVVGERVETVTRFPAALNMETGWTPPHADLEQLTYKLRVYDRSGRFDETAALPLIATDKNPPALDADAAAMRNIRIVGGAVTVYGRSIPDGYRVRTLGEDVGLDGSRSFALQRILPAGDHSVDIAIDGAADSRLRFSRNVNIPENDWFYVALADLTVGYRTGDSGIEAVRDGEYDKVYSKGRLAFYLKGKIKGEYLLTAAGDLGERELRDLFGDLDGRNPRDYLRYLDPNDYYPVYGDDSTLVEDAPTGGKFYVKLARGDSHVMWGNYRTSISGTEFQRSERELYGANAVYRSDGSTDFGERRTEATTYAATPQSLQQRDEFLATGGSAYFLRRQAITVGSESVSLEIRDGVSNRLIERRSLQYGQDYSINPLQGVLILRQPLSQFSATTSPVRAGAFGNNVTYIVVDYEYEPAGGDVDGYTFGGRVQQWMGDRVRVGATGSREEVNSQLRDIYGADILLRHSQNTFVRGEFARSQGAGLGMWRSVDGGLSWGRDGSQALMDGNGTAWSVEGKLDLADLKQDGLAGTLKGYASQKEAGFSTSFEQLAADRTLWGVSADIALNENVGFLAKYDSYSDTAQKQQRTGEATIAWDMDERWRTELGVSYTSLQVPEAVSAGKSGYDGERVDAGLRVEHQLSEAAKVYGFGQATLARNGDIGKNNRLGAGTEFKLNEHLSLSAELSGGDGGFGALVGLAYEPTAHDRYYFGYRIDPTRIYDFTRGVSLGDDSGGRFVTGVRRRLDERTTAYAENNYDLGRNDRTLAHVYGINFEPDALWTIEGGLAAGHTRDLTSDPLSGMQKSDFDRYAPSLGISYLDEEAGIKATVRGEVRVERSRDDTRDQNSYLLSGSVGWKTSEDWRLLASLDTVMSDSRSDFTPFDDTRFMEFSLGYAYRPADNDRLNALFRYRWVYDMPGNDQLVSGVTGDRFAPAQNSHILSVDANYRLTPWLTLGAKYGFRFGEIKNRIGDGNGGFQNDWQRSTAHLGILRADLHVVHDWDILLEGRVFAMPEADTVDFGAVTAIYRHIGDNLKFGLGYNFGNFSDDLRNLSRNDHGVFMNVVGKF